MTPAEEKRWHKWLGGTTELRALGPGLRQTRVRRRSRRKLDEPCIALCAALNRIQGVRTEASCCGHGEEPFSVWLYATTVAALHLVTRAIDPRYGAPQGWQLEVLGTDLPEKPVVFRLASTSRGVPAFLEAEQIATLVDDHLRCEAYGREFSIEENPAPIALP